MFKLLTEEVRDKVMREYRMRRSVVMLEALILLLVIGTVGLFPSFIFSSVKKKELLDKVEMLGEQERLGATNPQAWLQSLDKKLRVLSPGPDREKPSDFIEKVIQERSLGIILTSFRWSKDGEKSLLTLSGIARDRQSLLSFEDKLNSSGEFSNIILPVSNLAKDKDLSFQIKLSLSSKL